MATVDLRVTNLPLAKALQSRGISPEGWDTVSYGNASYSTLDNDEWFIQHRSSLNVEKLLAGSEWLQPGTGPDDLLSGSQVEEVLRGERSSWLLSHRIGNRALSKKSRVRSEPERLIQSWPYIVESIERISAHERRHPAPLPVQLPVIRCSVSMLRECPVEHKRYLLKSVDFDVDQRIKGAPEIFPLGRLGTFHSDLHVENMVAVGDGTFRPVDWEKLAVHPVITEACCGLYCTLPKISVEEWPPLIEALLPEASRICQLNEREVLQGLFWLVAATYLSRHASLGPEALSQEGPLQRGLQVIADMSH